MLKKFSKKIIAIFGALLILLSATFSVFTFSVAAAEPIVQSFETIETLKNVKYFTIYEATSAGDTNVYHGSKSLKWTAGSGTDAVSFWQSGMDLTVGETYQLDFYVKLTTAGSNSIVLKQLSDRSNGWAVSGKDFTVDMSKFTVGEWSKYSIVFTAEQRAIGAFVYGSVDMYFDYFTYTPVVTSKVNVSINADNGQNYTALSGAPGDAMTLPVVTKEGMDFGGWYLDSEFNNAFSNTSVFPDKDVTLYAKWYEKGVVVQNFEADYNVSSNNFSVYTAKDANDTNVKEGSKSLKWTHTDGTKVATLWCNGKDLTVGQNYKLEFWIKAVTSTASSVVITQLNDKSNGWAYGDNAAFTLNYFGTAYDSVNEWKKFEFTFTAQKNAMGIRIYGSDDFYFDNFVWTPVNESVTVNFVTNNGTTVEEVKSAPGGDLTLPTLTKDGYYFAGWYTDAEFTQGFNLTKIPNDSVTLYAKWIENGLITQNFENYLFKLSAESGFELYTATDDNDANVFEGKHSLYRNNFNKTRVAALSDPYTKLNVGNAYKVTFKLKVTDLGTGGGLQFTNLTVRDNPWSYTQLMSVKYIGTDYKYLNEWVDVTYIFTAEAQFYGFASWGDIAYYLDDFKMVEVPVVTVNFETVDGEQIEAKTGAAGSALTVNNPAPPKGMTFGGWYVDKELTEPYKISTFPETDITVYARWLKEGTYIQDFEVWPSVTGAYLSSKQFSLYTAKDQNDTNVYHGKHSMLYTNEDASNTFALNIFDETMGKLVVGEKYKVSIRFKPDATKLDKWSLSGTYHSIYYTKQQSNCWSFLSQGPQGRYRAYVFYSDNFGADYWSGTGNAVTTTTQKDENGWLTMDYEITAQTPYIALYMTGFYSMYIDYITIEALPSGVVSEEYTSPYAEEFYNILIDEGVAESLNTNGKNIYPIKVDNREDYVFTASLMKGVNGNSKVYLAWDAEGKNVIDGTQFIGDGTDYKLYSSRLITDFSGVVYLVVEGAGPGSCDYFALFKTKFGSETDPNPYYVHPTVNYDELPTKPADKESVVKDVVATTPSPQTGERAILPILLLVLTALGAMLTLRKRGNCNE